jgi:8-oxo-dGTP pyrophosphatase MutT (NUDIX family)
MISTQEILAAAQKHCQRNPQAESLVAELGELIASGVDVLSRRDFAGHVTCGAVVVRDDGNVLLIHHRALSRWLTPGGHLESTDSSLIAAAARELCEELSVRPAQISVPVAWLDIPIRIDRHRIPANSKKVEPEHDHWDFEFIFHLAESDLAIQEEEVTDWKWCDPLEHSVALRDAVAAAQAWNKT